MLRYLVEFLLPQACSEITVLLFFNSLVAFLAILITFNAFSSYRVSQSSSSASDSIKESNVCDGKNCFRCRKGATQCSSVLVQLRASLKPYPNLISILDDYEAANQWKNLEHVSFIVQGIDLPSTDDENSSNPYAFDFHIIESQITGVTEEFQILYDQHPHAWKVNKTPEGRWELCFIINQGVVNTFVAELCPLTYNILKLLPNLMTECLYGNVAFSIMHGNSKIEGHRGPTNARARCHLGLIVPRGCKLFVADEVYDWGQGKCTVFDDSQFHYVTNESTDMRVVLIFDLWNYNLTPEERKLISVLFSPD